VPRAVGIDNRSAALRTSHCSRRSGRDTVELVGLLARAHLVAVDARRTLELERRQHQKGQWPPRSIGTKRRTCQAPQSYGTIKTPSDS
jgi:hypothetical protein